MPRYKTVYQVPRNDLEAARSFYEQNKPITVDDMQVLAQLQDDPAELLKIAKRWRTRDPAQDAAEENDRLVAELAARAGKADD